MPDTPIEKLEQDLRDVADELYDLQERMMPLLHVLSEHHQREFLGTCGYVRAVHYRLDHGTFHEMDDPAGNLKLECSALTRVANDVAGAYQRARQYAPTGGERVKRMDA